MADEAEVPVKLEGLSSNEVESRRQQYGFNEVTPRQTPEWLKILKRFTGIVPLIMMITAILGVAVANDDGRRDWISFGLLVGELLLVVTVDYYSDRNAGNAISAVKNLSAPECHCKRDGNWAKVKVRELVPGDICFLGGGVVVPADGVLVGEGEPIMIDESSLTGEALAVTRSVGDEVLAGGVVQSGELDMMVTKVGENSFFGKTLALLGGVQEEGHLKRTLSKLAKVMAGIGTFFCIILFVVQLARQGDAAESVKLCFVILTAVVPIAMPVVTTTVLSIGALELSKESAVVTRLSAIEEMAGIEVLCSDKTGTLTLNQLHLDKEEIVCGEGFTPDYVLLLAALASKFTNPEPIDKAITGALSPEVGSELQSQYKVIRFIPFNPVDKRTESTVVLPDGKMKLVSKGAPHIIKDMVACANPGLAETMDGTINKKAEKGLRTLGVCWSDTETVEWEFVGFVSLFDPPREDTKETIEQSMEFGVDVKMVTGDQRAIAIETARRLGMGTNIVGNDVWTEGSSVIQERGGLGQFIMSVNGFAGVYPEHKYKIVEALQQMGKGKLVGMTGDGVNDAPALKKANVGIAVAGATDAAKGAADIILLKPGLSTIVKALFTSRTIFQRIQNYIMYRLASSCLILFFFFLSVTAADYSFPTWTLILLSLINDFTIMSTAKDNVISAQSPQHWDLKKVLVVAGTLGVTNVIGSLVLLFLMASAEHNIAGAIDWWSALWNLENLVVLRTSAGETCQVLSSTCHYSTSRLNAAMYLALAVTIQLNIFSSRTKSYFWHFTKDEARPPAIIVVIPVLASMLLSTLLMAFWPADVQLGGGAPIEGIAWEYIGVVWAYCVLWFILADFLKVVVMRKFYSGADVSNLLFGSLFGREKNREQIQAEVRKEIEKFRRELGARQLSKDGIQAHFQREDQSRQFLARRANSQISMMSSQSGFPRPTPSMTPSTGMGNALPQGELARIDRNLKQLAKQLQILIEWRETLEKCGVVPTNPQIHQATDL